MSASKDSSPKKNLGQVIDLKVEPKLKSIKKSAKKKLDLKVADPLSQPLHEKKLKTSRLLREQNEYLARFDAALSPIPDIFKELRDSELGIQTQITSVHQDLQKSAQSAAAELQTLQKSAKIAEQRYSRLVVITVCAVVTALFFGIYLIYDSKVSSQLILQKISVLETAINQNEVRTELSETRRTLSDAIKVNQQRIGENQKATQSMAQEIRKLTQTVAKLYELERTSANSR